MADIRGHPGFAIVGNGVKDAPEGLNGDYSFVEPLDPTLEYYATPCCLES